MGNSCCKKQKMRKIVLLLLGLDNAGKTVTANGLIGESTDSVVPTVGFSRMILKYGHYEVNIYDLGGAPNIRGIWQEYFVDAHGVIFVVDSTDYERFKEVESCLNQILTNQYIKGKPLLLLANKQDQEAALDEIDVIEELNLEKLVNNHQCPTMVQACAATELKPKTKSKVDSGIKKGYDWLVKFIIKNYETLNTRVESDIEEQTEINLEKMRKKIERIAKSKKNSLDQPDAITPYSEYMNKINQIKVSPKVNSEERLPTITSTDPVQTTHPVIEPIKLERPKSAVELIKQQLILNNARKKPHIRQNKISPGLSGHSVPRPKSAIVRQKSETSGRLFAPRSAGSKQKFLSEFNKSFKVNGASSGSQSCVFKENSIYFINIE